MRATKWSAVASLVVVNGFLARLLELVFPSRDQQPSSLFWSAKDWGKHEGGKTAANLAAIRWCAVHHVRSFRRQA
ncbi:hypothetical protein ES705_41278 [subsurface metagenome]